MSRPSPPVCVATADPTFLQAVQHCGRIDTTSGGRKRSRADVFARALLHAVLAARSVVTGWGHIAAYSTMVVPLLSA